MTIERHKLGSCFVKPTPVRGIDNEDDRVGIWKVMAPHLAYFMLSPDIKRAKGEVAVLKRFGRKPDGGDRNAMVTILQTVQNRRFARRVQSENEYLCLFALECPLVKEREETTHLVQTERCLYRLVRKFGKKGNAK